jgi:hypothetical protein
MSYQFNYLLGQDVPRFKIYDSNWNEIETIDLMLCGLDGLEEKRDKRYIEHELLSGKISRKEIGHYKDFTLSYSDYSPIENSKKIEKIMDYFVEENYPDYHIILYRNIDILTNHYEIIDTTDDLTINNMKHGIKAIGNRNLVLKFKTKYLQKRLNWSDPNDVQYHGCSPELIIGVLQIA